MSIFPHCFSTVLCCHTNESLTFEFRSSRLSTVWCYDTVEYSTDAIVWRHTMFKACFPRKHPETDDHTLQQNINDQLVKGKTFLCTFCRLSSCSVAGCFRVTSNFLQISICRLHSPVPPQ